MGNINTIGTTNATVIAQRALEQLVAMLPFLRNIATDLSGENAKFGETIIVHEVAAAEAINFDPSVGYVPAARTQVDIPCTLNEHVHHTYEVSVQEASSSRVDLIERFGRTGAYAVGAKLVSTLMALCTESNFANKTVKALGSGQDGFDWKTLQLISLALDNRDVPPMGRFMLLNPAYYASLCMDKAMLTILLSEGASSVKSGILPEVNGFAVNKFNRIPGNNENLVGIAGISTALALATRIPEDPGQGSSNCSITVATEPQTGLSIQVREWYEPTPAKFRRSYTLMFGVGKGQTDCLQRIVSQAQQGG